MQLRNIPIDELKVSKLNMRHGRKPPDIDDIYPSVLKSGVLETMIVRREGEKWGVVAGRRRLFALRRKAKETGRPVKGPCAIMAPGDDAAAMEASIIENTGHLPATEMQQYEAFGRLAKTQRSVDEIADYFGVTPLKVKRILALADVLPEIRALYADDAIDPATIRALTMASHDQQRAWLDLYHAEDQHAPLGKRLKDWLFGGAAIATDKALFDLADYPGRVIEDLFGEHARFEDPDLFWEHQSAAIAGRIDAYREKGWKDVTVMERGAFFHSWDHVRCPKSKGGKVFVSIRHDGEVTFHEGYVTSAEHRRSEKARTKTGDVTEPAKPEMSGPMAQYIALHRHGAARASLLQHPAIALRLTVAHMIAGSALWDVRPHDMRTPKAATAESVSAAPAAIAMSNEGLEIETLFSEHGVRFHITRTSDDYRLCEVFAALMKMCDAEVMRVLSFVMAACLEAGGAAVEAVAHVTATDMGAYWKPDEAFFDLLRDKRAINAMVADIASPSAAKAVLTDTAKTQKQIIRDGLTGNGREGKPDWRPGWMMTPPTALVAGAASPPAEAWTRIAALFEPGETPCAAEDAPARDHPAP
ncbi:ParB/RepB/Spo0J family partition protein [Hyphomonas sp. CY54-11-8]|uniref:ParB/RepB/Spo0J family partition protein n=1 Tax=Hyphomonas sp. CY54-11-8 TaxID=1280944 RepID=UPI000458BF0F|nr:ParB/RepB/Spo0J family partition protein [Hyphomonas sp. CY54-11-8]KCZ48473.1 hypothetical protein HY17_16615 [Hyphomonas sp. CY54-11-8]